VTDRRVAGIFSLAWGLALMSAIGIIYVRTGVSYRMDILPLQLEFSLILYLVAGIVFHFSMIAGRRYEWLNIATVVLSALFFVAVNVYQLPRSTGTRYLLSFPIVLWVMAWLVISMADYRKIFDQEN
jgi:hypothetical protein